MKKRLISLLVALCMAVTLLPVSAITAWAEESSSNSTTLRIEKGYPVGSGGEDWSYDGTTLDLHPANPTEYDFSKLVSDTGNALKCALTIGEKATITDGRFINNITNSGTITGGLFLPIDNSLTFANFGTITGGEFLSNWGPLDFTNSISGTIEGGVFRVSSLSNSGTIKGGIFSEQPAGGTVASGYTLNVNFPENGSYERFNAEIKDIGSSGYVIPNSNHSTSISIYIFFRDSQAILFPIDVTFGDTHRLLEDWAPGARYYDGDDGGRGYFSVTFTAPHADADTVTLSMLTRLVIDKDGYPAVAQDRNGNRANYTGDGWNFNASNNTLTLESGDYDFSGKGNALNPAVQLEVKSGAKLTGGAFAKEPKGAGTFKTVILNGDGSITAVNGLASGDWGNELYAVKTGNNTITASKPILDINRILLENVYPDSSNKNTVCINIKSLNSVSAFNPEADIILNQASHGLSLIMDSDGTPVIGNAPFKPDGNYYNYYGDGWYVNKASDGMSHGILYLTGEKTYNFRFTDPVNKNGKNLSSVNCDIANEGSIIEDGVFNTLVANGLPNSTSSMTPKIKGGTFAAGLYDNNGEITGGAFNGKDSIFTHETVLSGNYRSVTVKDGAILKVNDTLPLIYDETAYHWIPGSAWDLYSYAGTVLTVEADADITNINGQEIGKAFNSSYPNGETDKTVVCFEMPDSDVELNSTKIVDPDPKPEPKPDPTPEASTYTLTVKGGTFTYNGGEAMTSANVPVDAEVKVTLNQSAVPEGMVFDLWAMDEASLLGNPAVAYNEESFTIPAGSVAKGSTVTVEAQYRDATIESEPSILGTAAIIGVAGAGTAVIVWQGYRIGMELYEKYFQPTPEETAAEQPAPEAPAAAAAS